LTDCGKKCYVLASKLTECSNRVAWIMAASHGTFESSVDSATGEFHASARNDLRSCEFGRVAYQFTRFVVSFVLMASAILKLHEISSGARAPPLWLTVLAPGEIFLGVWLASGVYAKHARLVSFVCFTMFAVAALVKFQQGHSSCGCFGAIRVHPLLTYLFDVTAAAALACFSPSFTQQKPRVGFLMIPAATCAAIVLATVFSGTVVHYAVRATSDEVHVLEPTEWLGRRFALLESIDIGPSISDGHWIVVLVQQGCPHCREAIPRYEELAEWHSQNRDATRIALVEIPPFSGQPPGVAGKCVWGRLDDTQSWFVSTPTEITLHDGLVTSVMQGASVRPAAKRI
jgi:Methylamine utilisation protein MauE